MNSFSGASESESESSKSSHYSCTSSSLESAIVGGIRLLNDSKSLTQAAPPMLVSFSPTSLGTPISGRDSWRRVHHSGAFNHSQGAYLHTDSPGTCHDDSSPSNIAQFDTSLPFSSPKDLCLDSDACIPISSSSAESPLSYTSTSTLDKTPSYETRGHSSQIDSQHGDPFTHDTNVPIQGPCAQRLKSLLLDIIEDRKGIQDDKDDLAASALSELQLLPRGLNHGEALKMNLATHISSTNSITSHTSGFFSLDTKLPQPAEKIAKPSSCRLREAQRDNTLIKISLSLDATTSTPAGILAKNIHPVHNALSLGPINTIALPQSIVGKILPRYGSSAQSEKRKRSLESQKSTLVLGPLSKKCKFDPQLIRASSKNLADRTVYHTKQTASFRRAESLRSQVSPRECRDDFDTIPHLSKVEECSPPTKHATNYPPTVPVTPLPDPIVRRAPPGLVPDHPCRKQKIPPVPIIAPPSVPEFAPFPLLSPEDYAEERIKFLLLKEIQERQHDGFDTARRTQESKDNKRNRRNTSVGSSVSDEEDDWEDSDTCSLSVSVDSKSSPEPMRHRVRLQWARSLGVEDGLRKGIIGWMLDVLPELLSKSLPGSPNSKTPQQYTYTDLYEQLNTSPETRFHAVYLFMRYFFNVVGGRPIIRDNSLVDNMVPTSRDCSDTLSAIVEDRNEQENEPDWDEDEEEEEEELGNSEPEEEMDTPMLTPRQRLYDGELTWGIWKGGRESVTWDIAIGCLALSVKLHRDFLPPLNPVYASDFLELAPHEITHEDLEVTQRDLLLAFSFCIGSNTPQSFLDELWIASPTLRKVVECVNGGWEIVQKEIWEKLFDSLLEPDILRFRISLLTAATLLDSLVVSLARQYKSHADEKARCRQCRPRAPQPSDHNQVESGLKLQAGMWQAYVRAGMYAIDNVVLDMKDLLQISDHELEECRTWVSSVGYE
ncbi:hypothetical protein BJ138DRAFT_1194245 [Hygrophoropsis aurantiaca]|uniref:Uncharacterized protein n=1 Tax=Hygrophoropsis aurantiaca TaxID=72124 RepID=A0ACB8A9X9_9AGAM|nr:hypothetical protein BJ138DRAFT_1194245 [Hygrophoropsis aurantiaca]